MDSSKNRKRKSESVRDLKRRKKQRMECHSNDGSYGGSQVKETSKGKVQCEKGMDTTHDTMNAEKFLKTAQQEAQRKEQERQERFEWKMKKWYLTFKPSQNALSALLGLLSEEVKDLSFLKKKAVSFLGTPTHLVVEKVLDGDYHYFGLAENIKNIVANVQNLPDEIKLCMGFDGAPLTKAGKKEFWPIMVGFLNVPTKSHTVFTASLYCSEKTIENPKEIFKDFIPELNKIHTSGLNIEGKHHKIKMASYILDAPAKSKATGLNGHTGYFSCSRCWVMGMTFGHRRSFQAQDIEARSHDDWLEGYNCLADIIDIDFQTELVLDVLHLACQGCQKKLLRDFWVDGKHRNKFAKLSSAQMNLISSRLLLLSVNKYLPREFSNYPRTLEFVHKLKAKEFRSFYLYVGIIVMQFVLEEKAYQHFLRFHISFTILLSGILCKDGNIDIAEEQLRIFVEEFASLYGEEYVSHNIHGLIHVADDARKYGPLDRTAAWKMENHIGKLVDLTQKPSDAVQQVVRRVYERNLFEALPVPSGCEPSESKQNGPTFKMKHTNGPLLSGLTDPQFSHAEFSGFTLSFRRFGDSCFLTRSGDIVLIENFASSADGEVKIIGKKFTAKEEFYTEPLRSSNLGIWQVSRLSEDYQMWSLADIWLKLVILPKFPDPKKDKPFKGDEDSRQIFGVFPMVHFGDEGNLFFVTKMRTCL